MIRTRFHVFLFQTVVCFWMEKLQRLNFLNWYRFHFSVRPNRPCIPVVLTNICSFCNSFVCFCAIPVVLTGLSGSLMGSPAFPEDVPDECFYFVSLLRQLFLSVILLFPAVGPHSGSPVRFLLPALCIYSPLFPLPKGQFLQ